MRIKVHASVSARSKKLKRERLLIETVQERTVHPDIGETLIIESWPPACRSCHFQVMDVVSRWKHNGTEEYEIWIAGDFEDLVLLALTSGWHVVRGIEELSPDQRSLVRCESGTCNHTSAV